MRLYVINGCECYLSEKTIREYEAELREMEWERDGWKIVREARATWERTQDPQDWDYYSDLFKDLHGVRPRH